MFKERLKKLAEQSDGKPVTNKKKIENLIVFIIILVITVIAINSIWNKDSTSSKEATNTNNKNLATTSEKGATNIANNNEDLEKKLEAILGSISGVGKVNVCLNYSESSQTEAMYNETTKESSTQETDTSGGVRTIEQTDTQKDVIFSEDDGKKTPVTQKVINPTIEGAIITAQGANDSNVKADIVNAVAAVTGLASHKIQVFKMEAN